MRAEAKFYAFDNAILGRLGCNASTDVLLKPIHSQTVPTLFYVISLQLWPTQNCIVSVVLTIIFTFKLFTPLIRMTKFKFMTWLVTSRACALSYLPVLSFVFVLRTMNT